MFNYCVLKKNNSKSCLEISRTGFSVLAFVLGPLWALMNKMWTYSALGIIFIISFKLILLKIDQNSFFPIVTIVSNFFWGFFGRDLYIQNLINKNFCPLTHIAASSKENAIIKFLSKEIT